MKTPKFNVDIQAEKARMGTAACIRIGYEAIWSRGNGKLIGHTYSLDGPWGQMITSAIEGKFAPGPKPDLQISEEGEGDSVYGRPLRWAQIAALADLSFSPLRDAVRHLALLYRQPLKIGGDIQSPAFDWLRTKADIDRTMIRKQALWIGLGAIAVRPTLEAYDENTYYPSALTVVYPDRCIAIEDPACPGRPVIFIEFIRPTATYRGHPTPSGLQVASSILVWDISDPANPSWGEWGSIDQWKAGYPANWEMRGEKYFWRYNGEVIMPVECLQWDEAATELLPANGSELQGVIDLVLQRAWINVVGHAGSFTKALIMSDEELTGLEQSMADPNVVLNVWGVGNKDVKTIPDSTASTERQWNMHRDRLIEWAQRYDTGFEVRESHSAKSGTALALELTGKFLLRQRMETRSRPGDIRILQSLIATHNQQVRCRMLPLYRSNVLDMAPDKEGRFHWRPDLPATGESDRLIPEGDITIGYPNYLNSVERKEVLAELESAVKAGRESPRAIYLVEHNLEDDRPDGPNWVGAGEDILRSLTDKRVFAEAGYDVASEKLWQGKEAGMPAINRTTISVNSDDKKGQVAVVPTSLNGAQMDAALRIVEQVLNGRAPRDTAVGQLQVFLGVSTEQADSILGDIGQGFEPRSTEGYDSALRDSTKADIEAAEAASRLLKLGASQEQVDEFLSQRGIKKGLVGPFKEPTEEPTEEPTGEVSDAV